MNQLNWKSLDFSYKKTNGHFRAYFKNGSWSSPAFFEGEEMPIHIAATCLHYGQEAFEGLKAFKGKDGKVRVFRIQENAKRLQKSALGIGMEPPPVELFVSIIESCIKANLEFVPPYGSGASLYIRPLLIGTGPQVGVKSSSEFCLSVFVTPVGPYFKTGLTPTPMVIMRAYDRAAPQGTGHIKVGGNYAASILASKHARDKGYSAVLFLDSKEKKYIDECGPANFFGIKDNTYVTPESNSILPSITNDSLIAISKDLGLQTERRKIEAHELETFDEAGACGTAAVISPISHIDDFDTNITYIYTTDGKPGPWTLKLYNQLTGIQLGDIEDTHNWNYIIGES